MVAGQAATGLAMLALARGSDPGSLGIFAALYAASFSVGGLLDFGSSQMWARDLSTGISSAHFRPWLRRRTLAQLPVVVLFAVIALRLAPDRVSNTTVVALSLQALTFSLAQGALAAVRGLRSGALAVWLIAAGNLVTLFAAVSSAQSEIVERVAVASTLSWLLTAVLALRSTRSLTKSPSRSAIRNPWHGSLHFGIFSSVLLAQGFSSALIASLSTAVEAGNLAAITQWTQPVYLVASAYTTHMFTVWSAAPSDARAYRLLRPVWILAGVGAVVSGLIFALAPQLVHWFLGPKYEGSIPLLRLSALAATPVFFAQPLAGFLQARRNERFVAAATGVGVLAVLVVVSLMAPRLGASVGPLTSGALGVSLAVVYFLRARRAGLVPSIDSI